MLRPSDIITIVAGTSRSATAISPKNMLPRNAFPTKVITSEGVPRSVSEEGFEPHARRGSEEVTGRR
jgi:hypothetical protein